MLKRVYFNQTFLFSLGNEEGNPLSNKHYLEFMGPIQSKLFLGGSQLGEKLALDNLQKMATDSE